MVRHVVQLFGAFVTILKLQSVPYINYRHHEDFEPLSLISSLYRGEEEDGEFGKATTWVGSKTLPYQFNAFEKSSQRRQHITRNSGIVPNEC